MGYPKQKLVHFVLLVGLLAGLTCSALAQDGGGASVPAQGLLQVGGLGGLTRAMVALEDGGALLAEGDALLHLDSAGAVLNRAVLGHGQIQDVAVRGQLIYAMTEQGLVVVERAALETLVFQPGGGQAVAVTGDHIYGAAQLAGLRVAPLDAQGLPGDWRQVVTPGAVHALAVDEAGLVLYAALGELGINTYDLSGVDGLQLAGTISDIGRADVVRVVGNRLLVGTTDRLSVEGGNRLLVFDLAANRFLPLLVQTYSPLHDAQDVILRQDWAYVADRVNGLKRYAIGDLYTPRVDAALWEGTAYGLAQDARYLYVAAGWQGVQVFDAGLPDAITRRGWAALPGAALAVAVEDGSDGRWGVAAMGEAGAAILDLRDVDRPQMAAVLELPGAVQTVALRGTLGLAGLDSGEVIIFSVADPVLPRVVATLSLPVGVPLNFTWDGTLVYIAAGQGGLFVLDIIRPTEPVLVGMLEPGHGGRPFLDVALDGNGSSRAYVSTGDSLVIVDVAAPDDLHILAEFTGSVRAAAVRNFIAYAVGGSTVTTINAASSNAPVQLGAAQAVRQIQDFTAVDDAIWVTGAGGGALAERLAVGADGSLEPVFSVGGGGDGLAVAQSTGGSVLIAGAAGDVLRVDQAGAAVLRAGASPGSVLAALADGLLLIGGETWQRVDVSALDGPKIREGGSAPGLVLDITGDAERVYLALGEAGITSGDGAQHWLPDAGAGAVQAAAVDGSYLWVAEDLAGQTGALRILTAEGLATVAALPLPGPALAVHADGGTVYAGYGDAAGGGLAVVDGRAPTGGLYQVSAVDGGATDFLTLPEGGTGYGIDRDVLTVYATGDRLQPAPVRMVTLPQPVERLALVDTPEQRYLVGLEPGQAILILDLAEPTQPHPVAALPIDAVAIKAVDDALFLAQGSGELAQVRLANLADLAVQVRPVDSAGALALWHSGDRLYVAGPNGDLRVYDVSDPVMPEQVAMAAGAGHGVVRGLVGRSTRRDGVWLLLATDEGVQVWQHTPDGSLTQRATLDVRALQVFALTDHLLYYQGQDRALHVAALDSSTALAWDFALPQLDGLPAAVLARQDDVLVSTSTGVYALAWPPEQIAYPAVIGLVDGLPGPVTYLQPAANGTVWVGGADFIAQIDVSTPEAPTLLGVNAISGGLEGLALLPDKLLAVATADCGVRLWDVSAAVPQEVGYWQVAGVRDVARLDDGLAVLGQDGLTLLRPDLTTPPVLPPVPYAPNPPEDARIVGADIVLSWGVVADSCAALTAEVWVSADGGDSTLAATTTENRATVHDLPPGAAIMWQVRVVDGQGDAIWGPVWGFMTEPTSAGLPLTTMEWSSATPDGLPDQAIIGGSSDEADSPGLEFSPGTNWRVFGPLLGIGLVLEGVLVIGLVLWWRRSKQRTRYRL